MTPVAPHNVEAEEFGAAVTPKSPDTAAAGSTLVEELAPAERLAPSVSDVSAPSMAPAVQPVAGGRGTRLWSLLARLGQSRKAAAVLGVAGLVLVAVGAWTAFGTDRAEFSVAAGREVAVNQDARSIAAHNSPVIVASPTNASTLVVAGRIDRPQFSAAVHFSHDAGLTWTDSQLVLPEGHDRPFAPDIAFDSDGTLYVLFATLQGPGNVPGGLWLERSADAGRSFSPPVAVTGPYAFQPRLAVDPRSDAVHVTWVQASSAVENLPNAFGPPPNPVVMATSSDRGVTFGPPVQVSDPSRLRVGAATPVVGPGGEVLVLYQDFTGDEADFAGMPGPVYSGVFSLVLARSSDRGERFSTVGVVEPAVVPAERFLVYLPKFPSLAVAPDGTLYVAWSDARNGDRDVFLRRSDDGGKRWSDRVRVNDDPLRSGKHQYLPQVSVGADGRVDVVYLDRRADPRNVLTQASFATSFNRGDDWSTISLSGAPFDSSVGPGSEQGAAESGSRLGLVSASRSAYAVWTDTRRRFLDTDKQDLFLVPVQIRPE